MSAKTVARERRKKRIRKTVVGTSEKPRLSVFRSSKHIYVQVIDDSKGCTLAAANTLGKDFKDANLSKQESAKKLGSLIGSACKEKNIQRVVFDRNGYIYHGRVVALAEGARESGLVF